MSTHIPCDSKPSSEASVLKFCWLSPYAMVQIVFLLWNSCSREVSSLDTLININASINRSLDFKWEVLEEHNRSIRKHEVHWSGWSQTFLPRWLGSTWTPFPSTPLLIIRSQTTLPRVASRVSNFESKQFFTEFQGQSSPTQTWIKHCLVSQMLNICFYQRIRT